MLVLRSLATMRDISPDYLSRFTSHVDTLLSLDQCNKEKQASAKKAAGSESGQKPKNRRAKVL
jgi:predicted lipoprotein